MPSLRDLRKKLSKKRKAMLQKCWTHGAPSKMTKAQVLNLSRKMNIAVPKRKKKRKKKKDPDETETDDDAPYRNR